MILAQVINFVLDEKRVHKLRKEQSQYDIPKEKVNRSNFPSLRARYPLLSRGELKKSRGESAGESQDHGSPAESGDFQLDPDARVFANPVFLTESVAPEEDKERNMW